MRNKVLSLVVATLLLGIGSGSVLAFNLSYEDRVEVCAQRIAANTDATYAGAKTRCSINPSETLQRCVIGEYKRNQIRAYYGYKLCMKRHTVDGILPH